MSRVNMFKPMLFVQWKSSTWTLAILTPLCVALPILIAQFATAVTRGPLGDPASDILRALDATATFFPILAGFTGCALALCAWIWDHDAKHVYALSLPVERWRYALLKMGSSAVLLAIPLVAMLFGLLIATSLAPVPPGLHAYPFALWLRFVFAALIVYAFTFAFAAGTLRTANRILTVFVGLLAIGLIVATVVEMATGYSLPGPMELLGKAMGSWPGPFNVFGGSWMMIDV